MLHANQCYSLKFNQFTTLWDSRVQIDDKIACVIGIPHRQFEVKKHTPTELILDNLTLTEVKLIAQRHQNDMIYLQAKAHGKRKWKNLALLCAEV